MKTIFLSAIFALYFLSACSDSQNHNNDEDLFYSVVTSAEFKSNINLFNKKYATIGYGSNGYQRFQNEIKALCPELTVKLTLDQYCEKINKTDCFNGSKFLQDYLELDCQIYSNNKTIKSKFGLDDETYSSIIKKYHENEIQK